MLELLVAVSITVVMVSLMLAVVTNVLNLWNRSSGELAAENQARQALDLLARDMEGAVLRRDGNVWLAASVQSAGGASGMTGESWTNAKPAGAVSINLEEALGLANDNLAEARFGQAGVWLRLFAVEPAADDASAPRAISYQVVRRAVGNGHSYQLHRSSVSPQNTFDAGYDLFMPSTPTPSYNSGSGPAEVAGNIRRPDASFLLANDVVDFGVRFFASDGSVLFPQGANDYGLAATSDANRQPPEGVGGRTLRHGFPAVADVFLRILTPEGARQIRALESGAIGGDWWEIALANSQVYTRRISIASRPF